MAGPSETAAAPRLTAEWWELKSKALELEVFDVVEMEALMFSLRTQGSAAPKLEVVVVVVPLRLLPLCQTPER